MERLSAWWASLSTPQQLLLAVGVPVVAVVALVVSQRDRDDEGDDTSAGQPGGVILGGPAPGPAGGAAPDGGADLANIVRGIEDQFRATEEGLHSSVVDTAAALQADAAAREEDLEARLAETEQATEARQAELERQLARSQDDDTPRYDGREAVVARAYRDVLGREPDSGGLRYWVNSGYSASKIRQMLEASSEGKRLTS